jgi:hypothetical protein
MIRGGNDLHVHTDVSDGRKSPVGTLEAFARAGVETVVLTDHSAVVWQEVLDAAARLGITMPFPGTEISTCLNGRKHHVLLYGHALAEYQTHDLLLAPNAAKNLVLRRVLDDLRVDHPGLPSFDEILTGTAPGLTPTPGKQLGSRTAVCRALAHAGALDESAARARVAELSEARQSELALTDRYPSTLAVLELAADLDLTACLAHPLWECSSASEVHGVLADLEVMAELGLWGVATRSYHHRELDDHPDLRQALARHALRVIGGSDYHGNGRTEPGADPTDPEVLGELTARAAKGVRP